MPRREEGSRRNSMHRERSLTANLAHFKTVRKKVSVVSSAGRCIR